MEALVIIIAGVILAVFIILIDKPTEKLYELPSGPFSGSTPGNIIKIILSLLGGSG